MYHHYQNMTNINMFFFIILDSSRKTIVQETDQNNNKNIFQLIFTKIFLPFCEI